MPLQQAERNGRFALHGLHERAKMEMGQRRRRIVTKIILVVLVIVATLTECIVMRKSREYDAADNIAGLVRCMKVMVVLGLVGIAAAVAYVAA